MNIRVLYNVLLVRLGIRHVLPASYINNVRIEDNHESMIQLLPNDNIILAEEKTFFGRKGMVDRLQKAADEISKKGFRLHVFVMYRSPETQVQRRTALYEELRQKHPDFNEEEITRLLNIRIAQVGGGHQTGGAVDLTICDLQGRDLDMGTDYMEHNNNTATMSHTLNEEQRKNRKMLLDCMQKVGFVNYPAEWWHFAYGDKLWAAYSHHKKALYDVVQTP